MNITDLVADNLFVDYKTELKDILPKSSMSYHGQPVKKLKKFVFLRESKDLIYAALAYHFLNHTIPIDIKKFKFNDHLSDLYENFQDHDLDLAYFKIKFLQTPKYNIAYVASHPKVELTNEQRTYYIIYWYKLLAHMFIDINLATIRILPQFKSIVALGFVFKHNYTIIQSLKDIIRNIGYVHTNIFYRYICNNVIDLHLTLDKDINDKLYKICSRYNKQVISKANKRQKRNR